MEKTLFRTSDILHYGEGNEYFAEYFRNQAVKSGLQILEFDKDHIRMQGDRKSFFKYYCRSMPMSVKHGDKLSKELKRIISVLFWR